VVLSYDCGFTDRRPDIYLNYCADFKNKPGKPLKDEIISNKYKADKMPSLQGLGLVRG